MGRQGMVGDLLRVQIRAERERLGWSQASLASHANRRHKLNLYPSTIAKIEAGARDVTVDELLAFAELFGASIDVLLGRGASGTDVMWAASKLTSNAHRFVGEVLALQERLSGDVQDMAHIADRDHKRATVQTLLDVANAAYAALHRAREALTSLASEFPLPGMNLDREEKSN